jgi:hypothetical protein
MDTYLNASVKRRSHPMPQKGKKKTCERCKDNDGSCFCNNPKLQGRMIMYLKARTVAYDYACAEYRETNDATK